MSNLIYQLNHFQNIDSAGYNKFPDLATLCLFIKAILIIVSALIVVKNGINQLISQRIGYAMLYTGNFFWTWLVCH